MQYGFPATTFAEAPICTVGFFTYLIGKTCQEMDGSVLSMKFNEFLSNMFSHNIFQWELTLALLLGAMFVAPFGAFTTKVIRTDKISLILGILVTALGIWTLWKTYA